MGIVYTPNEVVNCILYATNRLFQKAFGQQLRDPGVYILDPFTGTGTFIVNPLQDEELMPTDKLPVKYKSEIWCNEILLIAYYIVTINIEYSYHALFHEKAHMGKHQRERRMMAAQSLTKRIFSIAYMVFCTRQNTARDSKPI